MPFKNSISEIRCLEKKNQDGAHLLDTGKDVLEQIVEGLALADALLEFLGLRTQLLVIERTELRLQSVDALDRLAVGFEQPFVAAAEDLGQECDGHRR